MIPGDLLSACPHRQFHTLPGLLDSWAALPNSNPNACMPMQGGSLYHFYNGLWYDPAERRTHDLPCERRTRYRLSQPDTVYHSCTLAECPELKHQNKLIISEELSRIAFFKQIGLYIWLTLDQYLKGRHFYLFINIFKNSLQYMCWIIHLCNKLMHIT